MWQEGGKYGSIDPCYPSKVAQAHIHNLLFHHHEQEEGGKKLKYLFFPCITHVPAGPEQGDGHGVVPDRRRRARGHEGGLHQGDRLLRRARDHLRRSGADLHRAVAAQEPAVRVPGARCSASPRTRATSPATRRWKAMDIVDADLQNKGRAILETVEEENRVAVLMIGRPYHSDPGLNHGVLEEFQVLGYPILSMRSIPKDPEWLHRFFESDIKAGRIERPLEVQDVWPENYSANSVQKVWAAKFAARHPNVVVLDLSSFKCGHDAPTYGLIDSIISTSATPYSALHDIDANKPGGSIKIRVKTYAHSLKLHEERLEDMAQAQRRAEVPHGGEAAAAARAQAAAARGAQAAGPGAREDDQRDQREGRRVFEAGRGQQACEPGGAWRPRMPAWCGWASRSASTIKKLWRAFNPDGGLKVETIEKTETDTRKRLPVLGAKANVDIDVDAELKKFEIEQMAALGLEAGKEHWRDDNPTTFTGDQRAHTTLLDLGPDDGARPVPAGRAARHRLQGQGDRLPGQLGADLRQGVRQPRSVQPDLLHRRQPGQVPDLAARRAEDPGQGHRRELRVRDRRRLRPLPLRHLRHRVPQGAARLRLRGLPRAAVPAAGRPQAGHRRGAGPRR